MPLRIVQGVAGKVEIEATHILSMNLGLFPFKSVL